MAFAACPEAFSTGLIIYIYGPIVKHFASAKPSQRASGAYAPAVWAGPACPAGAARLRRGPKTGKGRVPETAERSDGFE
jgi:hypothetical protein